jgi:alkylated DNA nucleotide flippase Atl1
MSARSRRIGSHGRDQPNADRVEPRTERIIRRVRAIPPGFVRTYGDIDPRALVSSVAFLRPPTMASPGTASFVPTGASPRESGSASSCSRRAS